MPTYIGEQNALGLCISREYFDSSPLKKSYTLENLMRTKLMARKEFWRAEKLAPEHKIWKEYPKNIYIPFGILGTSWESKFNPHFMGLGAFKVPTLKFTPILREEQDQAIKNLMQKRVGIMNAGTGTGKSYMILSMAARNPYKTLIIVSSTVCLEEMVTKCEEFCGVTPIVVGGKGKYKATTDKITVCMLQSLKKVDGFQYGCILVDECDVAISTSARQAFFFRISPWYLY